MSGRGQAHTEHRAIAEAEAMADRPSVVHIVSRLLVHGVRRKPGNCPCCGSDKAEVYRTLPHMEVLIDRDSGVRLFKTKKNAKDWDEIAAESERIEINFRCDEDQLPMLVGSDHKVTCALGGNRSGKTGWGVTWLGMKWLERGGKGARFWGVSPSREQTRIIADKLLLGEDGDDGPFPPVFPTDDQGNPLLATKWPETEYSPDQSIYMIDGSKITLKHAGYKGKNLKGYKCQAILVDECCEVKHKENWTIIMMRTADTGGPIAVSTTPIKGHWLKDMVVDKAQSDLNPNGNPDFSVRFLSSRDNPWIDPDEIQRIAEDLDDALMVAREIDGKWVGNRGNLWIHFDPAVHTYDGESFEAKDYGYVDVTGQAYRGRWRGMNDFVRTFKLLSPRYVAGQDFNTWPMTTVIAQIVVGTVEDRQDPKKWRIIVLDEVQTRETNSWKHAGWLNSTKIRGGRVNYQALAIACDSTGAYTNVAHVTSDKHSASDAKVMSREGHDCRPCDYNRKSGKPRNPRRRDSISITHRLFRENRIIIHSRCTELLRALNEQEDDGTGVAVKVASSASDRLSSPIDALRYLIWKVFSHEDYPAAIAQ